MNSSRSVQLPVAVFGQTVAPQTWWNVWSGNSLTVNVGKSSAPDMEGDVLDEAGSYGSQLGTLIDALDVLKRLVDAIDPARQQSLHRADKAALGRLDDLTRAVELAMRRHGRGSAATA